MGHGGFARSGGRARPAAKVSTAQPNPNAAGKHDKHVVIVYARDWRDLPDLRRILRTLRDFGLAQGWVHFKRDLETIANRYKVRGHKGVSVWSAPPGVEEISTTWITGKRLVVTDENRAEVIEAIANQDV